MTEIKLENVSYRYGAGTPFEKVALKNVSVRFSPGKITGLIGHTGSGKSTLAQLLNGIIRPAEGKVFLDGKDIFENPKDLAKIRFRVGLVFQYPEYQLFEETVYKDIAFGPHNMGASPHDIERMVKDAAHFCGVSGDMLLKSPFDLSGGQKRRVAIAGVIAMDPEVLILDEPAAGLDPGGREEILGSLRRYQREKEKTVILISHSMEDMARFADDILIMKDGAVFAHDSVDQIFENAALIEEAGLELPQITRLMIRLRELGAPVSPMIHTVEDACFEMCEKLKGRG